MSAHRIRHVDAFTSTALTGNPAAVVDGAGIDPALMQRIAQNQNLSETVFLLPPADPANDAHIRIFTPRSELPFAGHPIVAAAHILTEEGIATRTPGQPLRLETGAGIIPVSVEGEPPVYTMTQARPEFRESNVAREIIAAALGLEPTDITRVAEVSTGMWWLVAQVSSRDAMLRVKPEARHLQSLQLAIFCIGAQTAGADVHVRAFVLPQGIAEDPVTGSANGCIAALIARDGLIAARDGAVRYVAEQGIEIGQAGRVELSVRSTDGVFSVQVGGNAVTVLRGELVLDGA